MLHQVVLGVLIIQVSFGIAISAKARNDWVDDMVKSRTQKAIMKLEKEFTSVYKKYVLANTNQHVTKAQEQLRKDLAKVDKRSAELETRVKRSGACAPICVHRCIPSCNLACCVPLPPGYTKQKVDLEEEKAAKKSVTGSKKSMLSKADMEKGSICSSRCLNHCSPSCKFKCCLRVKFSG